MKTHKIYLVTLLLFIVFNDGFGQSENIYRPKLAIKYNPIAFIAYTPGIELGLESSVSANSSIHFGASYLSDFGIFENKNFEGYKAIGEYRIYNLFNLVDENAYSAFQFHLKQTFVEGNTFVDRANGSYQQLYDLKIANTSLEFLVANGLIAVLNPKFNLDFSVLYGVKRLSLAADGLPEDAIFNLFEREVFDFTFRRVGSEWYPVLRLQFKMNFVIR